MVANMFCWVVACDGEGGKMSHCVSMGSSTKFTFVSFWSSVEPFSDLVVNVDVLDS